MLKFIVPLMIYSSVVSAECVNRTVIDRLTGNSGQELVSQYSRTSCGGSTQNFDAVTSTAANCRVLWIDGVKTLECKDANNNYSQINEAVGVESKFPTSTHPVIKRDYTHTNSIVGLAINAYKKFEHSLPSEIANLHNNAIKIALEHGQNGDVVKWSDPITRATGNIRVATTAINAQGLCRTLLVNINFKTQRTMQEVACFNATSNQWAYLE